MDCPSFESAQRSPWRCVAPLPPHAGSPSEARCKGAGCGCPPSGTRSPPAWVAPAAPVSAAGCRTATGWRSRRITPLASGDLRVGHKGTGHPSRPPRSRRSPKSALTLGMRHCFFRHGLIVFFQVQPRRLVRQGLNHSQLHHPVRQRTQVPVFVAFETVCRPRR